jgi:1,4-alpha-glucan branching enzyme
MRKPQALSIVLGAHLPFARQCGPLPIRPVHTDVSNAAAAKPCVHAPALPPGAPLDPAAFLSLAGIETSGFQTSGFPVEGYPETPAKPCLPLKVSVEEQWFFEALSDTYLPLLEVFDRLEKDHIPFRLGISFSPLLCYMLQDACLLRHYLSYIDKQIEFGIREMERTENDPVLHGLARFYYERFVDKRILFTGRYGGNVLNVFNYYQKRGRIEFLITPATHAFLPIYTAYPEAIQAQIEVGLHSFRRTFGKVPHGFWIPELGWSPELDAYLKAYNFSYTIADTHAGLLKNPRASRGSFYPVRTPAQTLVLFRDYHAWRNIQDAETGYQFSPVYRDSRADVGFELPPDKVEPFLNNRSGRVRTGYAYSALGGRGRKKQVYDPAAAANLAGEQASAFLDARLSMLFRAEELGEGEPISLCAYDADTFGRFWYEGPLFLETLFREAAARQDIRFTTPGEYLSRQDRLSIPSAMPEFSSWGINGYAEPWLDASNDWMYPHVMHSLERMIELAERFPNDAGLKERALNQAAREILLAQASDWPRMLYKQEHAEYARDQVELALRNFTTIYESLGSNYISTEWLTNLERRHNFFPTINYRIFRRKR